MQVKAHHQNTDLKFYPPSGNNGKMSFWSLWDLTGGVTCHIIIYFKAKWDEMKEMDCIDLTAGKLTSQGAPEETREFI